jgi:hypothetical protein
MTAKPGVIDDAQRAAARVAGLAYLIPTTFVIYANFGMRGRLMVAGDAAETMRRIAASAPLFRLSVVFDLVLHGPRRAAHRAVRDLPTG